MLGRSQSLLQLLLKMLRLIRYMGPEHPFSNRWACSSTLPCLFDGVSSLDKHRQPRFLVAGEVVDNQNSVRLAEASKV
jgi:hypothetical protein